jgi:diacylglycerol O-acyltransferase
MTVDRGPRAEPDQAPGQGQGQGHVQTPGQGQVRTAVGRPNAVRELAIGLATFGLYLLVDVAGSAAGTAHERAARQHADLLWAAERRLHLAVEPALNDWLTPRPLLRTLANYEYGTTYIVAAFGLLGWLYARRPEAYLPARRSFVLLNAVAIGCFLLWPVMPPRLAVGQGFADTVTLGHTWGSWGSPAVAHANQLAAMPSLHVAWALWVSVVLAWISGGRPTQVFSAVHVLITVWVVLATANHYLLDAVGGAVLAFGCVFAPGCRPPAPDRLSAGRFSAGRFSAGRFSAGRFRPRRR